MIGQVENHTISYENVTKNIVELYCSVVTISLEHYDLQIDIFLIIIFEKKKLLTSTSKIVYV